MGERERDSVGREKTEKEGERKREGEAEKVARRQRVREERNSERTRSFRSHSSPGEHVADGEEHLVEAHGAGRSGRGG